jgi:hypothetical protein
MRSALSWSWLEGGLGWARFTRFNFGVSKSEILGNDFFIGLQVCVVSWHTEHLADSGGWESF